MQKYKNGGKFKCKYKYSSKAIKFYFFILNIFNFYEEKQDEKSKFGILNKLNLFINNYKIYFLTVGYFENKLIIL